MNKISSVEFVPCIVGERCQKGKMYICKKLFTFLGLQNAFSIAILKQLLLC
jgi:hypothetical protein